MYTNTLRVIKVNFTFNEHAALSPLNSLYTKQNGDSNFLEQMLFFLRFKICLVLFTTVQRIKMPCIFYFIFWVVQVTIRTLEFRNDLIKCIFILFRKTCLVCENWKNGLIDWVRFTLGTHYTDLLPVFRFIF